MEFIIQNYIWFIVGGVIIIMAIIGYIADKTDFGRKKENNEEINKPEKKKKEKPKKEEKATKIEIEPKGINELTNEKTLSEQIDNNDLDNLNVPLENNENAQSNNDIDPSLFTPLEDVPVSTNKEMSNQNDYKIEETPIAKSENATNIDQKESVTPIAEPINDDLDTEIKKEDNNLNEDISNADSIKNNQESEEKPVEIPEQEEKPVAEEEDVWKF